jgi:glucose-6-phosphate isomerase
VMGYGARAVIPYAQALARFPAFLQQLDMESNGKSVGIDGHPVAGATGPIVFGEPGTNGQHAFFQLLHQGTDVIPVEFILPVWGGGGGDVPPPNFLIGWRHHHLLKANCLAQAEALMRGKSRAEVEAELRAKGMPEERIAALSPHKVFPGDRPSTMLVIGGDGLFGLGQLIALHEHRVFVESVIWGINAFDQWGVELGKELATRLDPVLRDGRGIEALDPSTAGLIRFLSR